MSRKVLCSCGQTKEIVFQGDDFQYPVFSCPVCGPDKRNEWQIWMENYKDLWKEDGAWDKANCKQSCIIGYFCYLFKEFYGQKYVFSFANPIPYKDKDFIMVSRILTMFDKNAKEIKIYIKWVFEKRIRPNNYRINSIGFFASSKLVNEYFQAKKNSQVLKRSGKLPEDFIVWCKNNCPEIFDKQELETWNDINGLITYVKTHGLENLEGQIIKEAIKRNFLSNTLDYIKLEVR